MRKFGKRGLSPLIATILLIAFAISLGAVVMNWGKSYIEEKAHFPTQEHEELGDVVGCTGARLGIIFLDGKQQVCFSPSTKTVEIFIENGPHAALKNVQARVVGDKDVYVHDKLLLRALAKTHSIKTSFTLEADIGEIKQLRLTPVIEENGEELFCTDQALTLESALPNC